MTMGIHIDEGYWDGLGWGGGSRTYVANTDTAKVAEKGRVWHEGSNEKEDYKGSSPRRNFVCAYAVDQG